jgi:hypothetical protein
MKDKFYGFIAGFIYCDSSINTKKRGYSDNVAIFLAIMDCFTRQEVSPLSIMQEIERCYEEKNKYLYSSAVSHNTVKPSLAIALRKFKISGEVVPSTNMDMSADVIFRGIIPPLLQRFTNLANADVIVSLTHGAPMTMYYIIFITDFCKLIFDGVQKKGLQKFANGRGFINEILDIPVHCNSSIEIGETIRQALHMFFITDGVVDVKTNQMSNGLYGMFAGSYYGFKYLHENNLVKIDADIMDLIGRNYSD